MSKPLIWFLQLLGLMLILKGAADENYVMAFVGAICALIGAMGIRERIRGQNKG